MPSLRTETLNKAQVEIVPVDRIVTDEYKLCTFNMYTCRTNSTNFKVEFKLNVTKTCSMTSIVGYFDSRFDNNNTVILSTAPNCPPTHWKQTVFLLPDPIHVNEGNFSVLNLRFVEYYKPMNWFVRIEVQLSLIIVIKLLVIVFCLNFFLLF